MKILFVDDDVYLAQSYVLELQEAGHDVVLAPTSREAKKLLFEYSFDSAVLDIMMPPDDETDIVVSHGGFQSGYILGRWIRKNYPNVKLLGFTVGTSENVKHWFERNTLGMLYKQNTLPHELVEFFASSMHDRKKLKKPRCFIVHGHDETTKLELKNFLQNNLKLPEPIILHEQPSIGRTLIEKFEAFSDQVEFIFVLLTPDDLLVSRKRSSKTVMRRARQNVIFELGYFLGKLGRKSGRVFLLYKGNLDLPSDISGLVYINISEGVISSSEEIRREIMAVTDSVLVGLRKNK